MSQSKLIHVAERNKLPVVYINMQGETVWVIPASENGKIICGTEFAQVPGSTYQEMQNDGEAHCIPYGI